MAIDFPNSPTNGQTYTVGTKVWTYSSADNQWLLSSVSPDSGTLTAQGDLLTRSSSALTKLAVGSNGDMLVADSSATSGLRWQGQTNAGRNLVINGAMQVAQRGTSATGITASGYYTADRWRIGISGLGTWTQTVETDGPTGTGLSNSLKLLCTTAKASPAVTDFVSTQYRFEGQDLRRMLKGSSSAQQVTLSFWVKSNVTGTYIAEVLDNDNSRQVSASYTISSSATWEKKTITFPADTTGALDNDKEYSLGLFLWLGAGTDYSSGTLNATWASVTQANRAAGQTNLAAATNNYWQITGVQLEVGPVATGFDFEPYETTLRKCYRYYWRQSAEATTALYPAIAFGVFSDTSNGEMVLRHPVAMRARPAVLEYSNLRCSDYQGSFVPNSIVISDPRSSIWATHLNPKFNAGTVTQYRPAILEGNNSSSAYLAVSAEL